MKGKLEIETTTKPPPIDGPETADLWALWCRLQLSLDSGRASCHPSQVVGQGEARSFSSVLEAGDRRSVAVVGLWCGVPSPPMGLWCRVQSPDGAVVQGSVSPDRRPGHRRSVREEGSYLRLIDLCI